MGVGHVFIFVFIYYSLKRWSTGVPLWVCHVRLLPCLLRSYLTAFIHLRLLSLVIILKPPTALEVLYPTYLPCKFDYRLSKQPVNALCDLL